eukprot:GHUV01021830.1.p1 GENE.GHUV01021830.1~~GHUV01021830.1.p1  ORF type:complete len:169 (-),score=11.35 GHUV01021830.1:158-664(-)
MVGPMAHKYTRPTALAAISFAPAIMITYAELLSSPNTQKPANMLHSWRRNPLLWSPSGDVALGSLKTVVMPAADSRLRVQDCFTSCSDLAVCYIRWAKWESGIRAMRLGRTSLEPEGSTVRNGPMVPGTCDGGETLEGACLAIEERLIAVNAKESSVCRQVTRALVPL